MSRYEKSIGETFADISGDYNAAKRSNRFRRRRRGVPSMGASADWHYRNESDYLWVGEFGRELDRNDPVIGQMIDRAVDNTLNGGLAPEPNTGDEGLNQALKDRWAEESIDPALCDVAGQLTFHEQTTMVLRDTLVAGDIFALPNEHGPVQLVESHRCRSAKRTKKNMVHGIEMTPERKRLRAWFTKEPVDPLSSASLKISDLQSVEYYNADGDQNVWHVYFPKRATQTRGISALAPVFDLVGMHDDLQHAKLLHQQIAACVVLFRNRNSEFTWNNNTSTAFGVPIPNPGTERRVEGFAPGLEMSGAPGEVLSMDSPNIPGEGFLPHVKLILTMVGINVGMPLVLVLMDASETNFSGYRGAIDQARMGFRRNQQKLVQRWARPNWWWKIDRWSDDDAAIRSAVARQEKDKSTLDIYKHAWQLPAWNYIEPGKDAAADLLKISNTLTSPSRCAMERGVNWEDIVVETARDRTLAIEAGLKAAQKLNDTYKLDDDQKITWRDIVPLPSPEGVTVSITEAQMPPKGEEPAPAKPPARKPRKKSA